MSGQDANSKDMLSRIHEQRVKDQNNDSTQTGAFPMVKAKKRISLDAKVTRTRLYSSILVTILCALLGFGYVIQINNTTSTYETMSEDELTKLISETNAQVQKLEQRKNELSSQLNALKDTADKNEKAAISAAFSPRTKMRRPRKSPSRTHRPTASYPAVSRLREKAWSSAYRRVPNRRLTPRYCSRCLRNCATVVPRSLRSTMSAW